MICFPQFSSFARRYVCVGEVRYHKGYRSHKGRHEGFTLFSNQEHHQGVLSFSTQGAGRGSTTFTQGWGHSTTRRLPTTPRGEIAAPTTKMFHQGSSHNRKSPSQGSPQKET
ncbi:Hypothetical predicted protein [Olea europaea subsp. europaea]|uniref:Uncharacterized protein n=1 Tax=Olea europaea subsp. europaea TaxID=158383 RepID=A0A8S0UKN9_OLEEU|nr:Hypothetical predicted protein [Olea europaea subsp. europaea]